MIVDLTTSKELRSGSLSAIHFNSPYAVPKIQVVMHLSGHGQLVSFEARLGRKAVNKPTKFQQV